MVDYLRDSSVSILLCQCFSNFFFNHRILVQPYLSRSPGPENRMQGRDGKLDVPPWIRPSEHSLETISRSSNMNPQTLGQRTTELHTQTGSQSLPRMPSGTCALTKHHYISLWQTLEETVLGNGHRIYSKDIVKDIVYLVLQHLLWENPKEKMFPVLCA